MKRQEIVEHIQGFHTRNVDASVAISFLAEAAKFSDDEIAWLTDAIADTSIRRLNRSEFAPDGVPVMDLPSTGGAGNKTPLIVPPILASAGIVVPKMSSRGSVAGTIDILESVGYRTTLSLDEFIRVVREVRVSNIAQTDELAPVDARLMVLRRRTGMMNVGPLVISSILGKKLALGVDHLVIDVKAGPDGKFGPTEQDAVLGAERFVRVGKKLGMRVTCVVTDNSAPQGRAMGATLSMIEVAEVLQGAGPKDQMALCLDLAGIALASAGTVRDREEGRGFAGELVKSGKAMECFRRQLHAHGGRTDWLDDPWRLVDHVSRVSVTADRDGKVTGIDSSRLNRLCERLVRNSAGHYHYKAGLVVLADVGTAVSPGTVLADVYLENVSETVPIQNAIRDAFEFDQQQDTLFPRGLLTVIQ